jgi:hypothetical protein
MILNKCDMSPQNRKMFMMEVLEGSQSLRRNAVLMEVMGNDTVSCLLLDQRILLAARLHEKVAKMTSRNVCQVPFTRKHATLGFGC